MIGERDYNIDFLRTLGLLCVILAHVSAPEIIMRLRGFDVVLLVFVSGLSFLASKGDKQNYIIYFKKRICRLVFPTWKFLCLFFVIFEILHLINPIFPKFAIKDYFCSFSFLSGIGYVWIIRVYLLMAAVLPALKKILDKIGVKKYLCILTMLYIVYEVLIRAVLYREPMFGWAKLLRIIDLGYIFVCGIGLVIRCINKKYIFLLILIFIIVFIAFSLVNNWAPVQMEKYPPTAYYLSYGLLISLILYAYLQTDRKVIKALKRCRGVNWISQNSFWIYLWHIIPVKLLMDYKVMCIDNWLLRYAIILLSAFSLTALCNLVNYVIHKNKELLRNVK